MNTAYIRNTAHFTPADNRNEKRGNTTSVLLSILNLKLHHKNSLGPTIDNSYQTVWVWAHACLVFGGRALFSIIINVSAVLTRTNARPLITRHIIDYTGPVYTAASAFDFLLGDRDLESSYAYSFRGRSSSWTRLALASSKSFWSSLACRRCCGWRNVAHRDNPTKSSHTSWSLSPTIWFVVRAIRSVKIWYEHG